MGKARATMREKAKKLRFLCEATGDVFCTSDSPVTEQSPARFSMPIHVSWISSEWRPDKPDLRPVDASRLHAPSLRASYTGQLLYVPQEACTPRYKTEPIIGVQKSASRLKSRDRVAE
jgi:hypothetical protein